MSNSPKTPNLGKIGEARLDLIPTLDECNPGIEPTEYNVVIAPAKAAQTVGKAGLLIAPDEVRESAGMAMQVGRIIAASPVAFNYERWPDGSKPPQVGQLVWFARYAGAIFEGLDGNEYRILKDKDIGAIVTERLSALLTNEQLASIHQRPAWTAPAAMFEEEKWSIEKTGG